QIMPRPQNLWIGGCLAAGLAAVVATGASAQDAPTAANTVELPADQIEAIVRDYLMREPEVIYEALQELQRREAAAEEERSRAALVARRDDLFYHASSPVAGNPDGDVTLVEFFDYRCGFCRRVVGSLRSLVDQDPNLRIVFKEFPILGEDSVRSARAALAAERQGMYLPFHFALMETDDLSMDGILRVAESVGLDTDQLAADMEHPEIQAELGATYALARELGIEGTPAFVVGEQLIPGAVSEERLVALIDEARTN
ncbi:MAG: DsbA family protein, partial [Pseudomonadota bacterium]